MTRFDSRFRALAVVLALPLVLSPAPGRAAERTTRPSRTALALGPLATDSRTVLGRTLNITAASRADVNDPVRARSAIGAALEAAGRLEVVFAPDVESSELSRLNRTAAAERFACSADLYAALDAALAVAAATDGAYDPTAGPLARLWQRSGPGSGGDDLALADARQLVGWRTLLVDAGNRTVRFRRPGVELALDATAVGCVLERAAAVLRERGITRARLELGGELLTFTARDPWMAVVPRPGGEPATAMRLRVSNAAVATAVEAGPGGGPGVRDPRTGRRPSGEASVTVVTASAMKARALAEALRVMGRDAAAAYVHQHPEVGALWLEPSSEGVRAWAWNLDAVQPEPGLRVEWKEAP